jgi:hypothetical protein
MPAFDFLEFIRKMSLLLTYIKFISQYLKKKKDMYKFPALTNLSLNVNFMSRVREFVIDEKFPRTT